jgi:hypothetical protein
MVQAAHAALEAGIKFGKKSVEPSSVIILQVPNKEKLEAALSRTIEHGIACEGFFEPDWDYGLTSFGTEPVTADQRKIFKKYKLWKANNAIS